MNANQSSENRVFKAPHSYVTPKTHYSPFQSIRTWTQMKIRLLFKGNSNEISGALGFIWNGVLTQKLGFLWFGLRHSKNWKFHFWVIIVGIAWFQLLQHNNMKPKFLELMEACGTMLLARISSPLHFPHDLAIFLEKPKIPWSHDHDRSWLVMNQTGKRLSNDPTWKTSRS